MRSGEPGDEVLEAGSVHFAEVSRLVGVHIEHRDQLPGGIENRNHNLRTRAWVTGDVVLVQEHVLHYHGLAGFRRRAANAAAEFYLEATERALIRTDQEFP